MGQATHLTMGLCCCLLSRSGAVSRRGGAGAAGGGGLLWRAGPHQRRTARRVCLGCAELTNSPTVLLPASAAWLRSNHAQSSELRCLPSHAAYSPGSKAQQHEQPRDRGHSACAKCTLQGAWAPATEAPAPRCAPAPQPMRTWHATPWAAAPSTSCWAPSRACGATKRCARWAGAARQRLEHLRGMARGAGCRNGVIQPMWLNPPCPVKHPPRQGFFSPSSTFPCPPPPPPPPHPPPHPTPGAHPVQPHGAAAVPAGGLHEHAGLQQRAARVCQGRPRAHLLRGGGGRLQVGPSPAHAGAGAWWDACRQHPRAVASTLLHVDENPPCSKDGSCTISDLAPAYRPAYVPRNCCLALALPFLCLTAAPAHTLQHHR